MFYSFKIKLNFCRIEPSVSLEDWIEVFYKKNETEVSCEEDSNMTSKDYFYDKIIYSCFVGGAVGATTALSPFISYHHELKLSRLQKLSLFTRIAFQYSSLYAGLLAFEALRNFTKK